MKNTLKIFVIVGALALSACATTHQVQLVTKTIPVAVPLIYSPLPPVVARPDLPHLTISSDKEKVDGEVVKAYAASVEALLGYSKQLEDIIAEYKNVNDSYATLRAKLIADWKANTGVDITIDDPTLPKTVPVPGPNGTTIPCKPGLLCSPTPAVPAVGDLVKHP